MKKLKTILVLILIFIMFSIPSFAEESLPIKVTGDNITAADFLNELGILPYSDNGSKTGVFSGSSNKYGLEKIPTKLDGAIRFIEESKSKGSSQIFIYKKRIVDISRGDYIKLVVYQPKEKKN